MGICHYVYYNGNYRFDSGKIYLKGCIATDKSAIRKILRQSDKRKVKKLLRLVNLSHLEKKVIKLVEIKRYTEEEVAEKLEVSRNTVQNYKRSAFYKIDEVWSNLGGD